MRVIKQVINRLNELWARRSSNSYCKYLRDKGCDIGKDSYIYPNAIIDYTRPSLVSIGKKCFINQNFKLFTHDWVSRVFIGMDNQFLNSSGEVTIGNNVSFGHDVTVLKGVRIGDNCFIGAGSIVTKDIPANSVAAGIPAKVLMTIDQYYEKRLEQSEQEALDYARSIYVKYNRKPYVSEMREEFIWFVSGDQVELYPMLPIKAQLGSTYERYVREHKAKYENFDSFLEAAGIK